MDLIIGAVFFLFMLLVDWRLSRIQRELVKLNKHLTQSNS